MIQVGYRCEDNMFYKKNWGMMSRMFLLCKKVSAIWHNSDFWNCKNKYRGCSLIDFRTVDELNFKFVFTRTIRKNMRLEDYEVWDIAWLIIVHCNPKSIMPSIDSGTR